jgi:hypothetical protein
VESNLHFNGRLIAASQVRIQSRRQHLGQHSNRCASTMHPAHESGMHIAGCERQNIVQKLLMDRAQIGG